MDGSAEDSSDSTQLAESDSEQRVYRVPYRREENSARERTMTLTVITTDGSTQLSPYTITVPEFGKCEDLIRALSAACSLGDDETLLLAEISNNRIIRYLEEPTDSLTLIRDEDRLVAYRLAKDSEDLPLVVFMHERMEEQSIQGNSLGRWKSFGIPLVARLSGQADGSNLCSLYLRLLNPFRNLSQDAANENDCSESSEPEDATMAEDATTAEDALSSIIGPGMSNNSDVKRVDSTSDSELKLYLADGKGITEDCEIQMSEPVVLAEMSRQLNVLVCWPKNQIKKYDTSPLSSLPEIFQTEDTSPPSSLPEIFMTGFFSVEPR